MENNKFVYRKINPSSEDDMKKYFDINKQLDTYLSNNVTPFTEEQIMWLRIRMGATELLLDSDDETQAYKKEIERMADEHCFVCELGDEIVGHVFVCTYHIIDGKRPDDNIGIISEIYVKDEYRQGIIAYKLLQLAFDTLLNANKTSAILSVQEDNPNRFLHFALSDKILEKRKCTRKNGSVTTSYDLLISDIAKTKAMSSRELATRAIKIKKNYIENNLKEPEFILN